MKRLLKLPLFLLLILAALSLSDGNQAQAQAKKQGMQHKESKKVGPPSWAPAHGHRRKMEDAGRNYDDRRWRSRKEEMRQRERELERRDWDGKRGSEEIQKKRRIPADSPQRNEDILNRRQEEKRRQKAEEIRKRMPGL